MIEKKISAYMNPDVLTGEPDTPLLEIVSAMSAANRSACIICDGGVPVGVFSERDALSTLHQNFEGRPLEGILAADVMTSPARTLPETATMGEVIRVMQECGYRRVPIVDDKNRISGIVDLSILHAATASALERRGRDLEVAVMARTAELQAANRKLERLSLHDGLTGLLNRRAMMLRLEELHALGTRYGNTYSVILLDIDHFKQYNDALGHLQGDEALKRVAQLLQSDDSNFRCGLPLRRGRIPDRFA